MKFAQKHLALYAKNGYAHTDNIFSDVAICLRKDGHEFIKDSDPQYIAEFVGRKVRPFMKECRMEQFLKNISPDYCDNIGYFTINTSTINTYYYWEALLRGYLYELLMKELKELELELPEPSIEELLVL